MGVICIDERVWTSLVGRLKSLTVEARRVQKLFNPKTSDSWIDSQDVCRMLGITKRTLQTYREKGVVPFSSVGGKFFYREQDIADYLQTKTIKRR